MKIALIHYHLKRGGVTTVIKQQVASVADDAEFLIITGESFGTGALFKTATIKELRYDQELNRYSSPQETAQKIYNAIIDFWPEGCDLVHVHNPTLAKNSQLLKILKELQSRGLRLLLQIHDFAEDGRPQAYYAEEYPIDCHYAVINNRDYYILLKAGLSQAGLHQIPNAVPAPIARREDAQTENLILYPIRAIRRKNIGEAILLSLFFKNQAKLAITLPPNSPADIASYEGWKRFIKERRLNVVFDAGLSSDFEDLMSGAYWILTTSVTEGFGFSFLEPWIYGKPLWGRKIPQICEEFENKGIALDHLYQNLLVPVDWIDREQLSAKWRTCVLDICRQFDYSISETEVQRAFDNLTSENTIDFGLLDEGFQKPVVSRAAANAEDRAKLMDLNPFLSAPGPPEKDVAELIRKNCQQIKQRYNNKEYGKRLRQIYLQVMDAPVKHCIDKKKLFALFLDLDRFSLLKWSPYAG